MPFPATRHSLSYVDTAGRQGPGGLACADTQVSSLFRLYQFAHRHVNHGLRTYIQRRLLSTLSAKTVAPSLTRQVFGAGVGQCKVSSCPHTPALAEHKTQNIDASIFAAIQPRSQSNREGLETHSSLGYSQSAFSNHRRRCAGRKPTFHAMEQTKSAISKIMRHYLRRYV